MTMHTSISRDDGGDDHASASDRVESGPSSERSWWRSTWPLGGRELMQLGIAFVAIVIVFTVLGRVFTEVLAPNPITDVDRDVASWFADTRTDTRTELAHWGAFLSNTGVKIVATALLVAAALATWRRWHDGLLVALSLIFEASAFVVISRLVGRPRPAEARLDSPLDTGFPSGHVAAATVYLALAVIVAWHTRSIAARVAAATVAIAVAVVVSISRMYQGMHFLTDVIGGFALGIVTLAVTVHIITNSERASLQDATRGDSRERTI
jgi:membrane-associated phospholipid phosphatase